MGRIPKLAEKEITATATNLPFPWSSSVLPSGVFLLKSATKTARPIYEENGSLTDEMLKQIQIIQNRLGMIPAISQIVGQADRPALVGQITQHLLSWAGQGKFSFGLSFYLPGKSLLPLDKLGMKIKQAGKREGLSLRYVPAKNGQRLSSAQVFHNRLALLDRRGAVQNKGAEIGIFEEGERYWIGRTVTVQDIDSYAKRDFSIPKADPLSGMLPPKLAQAMLNLAVREDYPFKPLVYDPFCGNGRIVMEGKLMGLSAFGSDISLERVESARENIQWLSQEYQLPLEKEAVWVQDATQPEAVPKIQTHISPDRPWFIVTEPYLGQARRKPLTISESVEWKRELDSLYENFFRLWSTVSLPPKRMIVVFPRVRTEKGEVVLSDDWVDRLKSFDYSSTIVASYSRPNSLVSRDLVQIEYRV